MNKSKKTQLIKLLPANCCLKYLETLSVLSNDGAASSGPPKLHGHQHQLLHDVGQTYWNLTLQEHEAEGENGNCQIERF